MDSARESARLQDDEPAYRRAMAAIDDGHYEEAFDELGSTNCPEGCIVEADGTCPHGHRSLGLRLGLI